MPRKPTLRVYVGSGGVSSATAREITKSLRSNGVFVAVAKDFAGDAGEAIDLIRDCQTAVIVVGTSPLALVEGGMCMGLGIGALWAGEGDQGSPLCARPTPVNQILAAVAAIKQGYEEQVATLIGETDPS